MNSTPTWTFCNGKFVYRSFVTDNGKPANFEISLDLNNHEMSWMLQKALRNKAGKTVRANGALTVKVTR